MRLEDMNRAQRRAAKQHLQQENKKWPVELVQVPPTDWPAAVNKPMEVWRSCHFLVQVFKEEGLAVIRLSINRTNIDGERWQQDISWEELQDLKRQCGFGKCDAVEVFPPDADVVNVANMRHLWVMREPLPFVWRNARPG